MQTIMASLNLGQDVANKRERKQTAAHIVARSYSLYLAVKMCRYGSLININPSAIRIVKGKICQRKIYTDAISKVKKVKRPVPIAHECKKCTVQEKTRLKDNFQSSGFAKHGNNN